jgi:hypothetical protein
LFTESYGGKYGPAIGKFFQDQNARRLADADFSNATIGLTMDSLGIINGWIDALVQMPSFPMFAYDNTYGIQAIDQVQQLNALSSFRGFEGCQELISSCRTHEQTYDPQGGGNVDSVNDACSRASLVCQSDVYAPYLTSGRSVYDISQNWLNPFPDSHHLEYLNKYETQKAIGVPVNFTQSSAAVYTAFNDTGDYSRGSMIADLAELLRSGVRVALIYGDRDYICNWRGGEAVSFAIAAAVSPLYDQWYAAGYAPIVANSSYIGGVVREYGNLSFSRIYDAGHLVPAYQPETAFTVFSRVIKGNDISLGGIVDLSSYISHGELNSTHTNVAPAMSQPTCFIRAVNSTCDLDHRNMLANNGGVIINGVLYSQESDWEPPDPALMTEAGMPGVQTNTASTTFSSASVRPPVTKSTTQGHSTSTSLPTGVYTATSIPSTTSPSTNAAEKSLKASGHNLLSVAVACLVVGEWIGK